MSTQAQQAGSSVMNDHGILIDPTPQEIGTMERQVRQLLQQLAINNEDSIDGPQDVDVRDLLPTVDFDSGGDNSALENEWLQDTLTGDQFNETYQIDATAGGTAENRYVAIIGLSNLAGSPSTTEVQFTTSNGALFEHLQVEGLLTDEETFGLLADPIITKAGQQTNIDQYVTATSDRLVFHGAVAEKSGDNLEDGITRFFSDQQRAVNGGRARQVA